MKILVDGTPLVRQHTGVAQYVISIMTALAKIDPTNDYYLYTLKLHNFDVQPISAKNFHYRYIRMPIKVYSLFHRVLHLPLPVDLLARVKPDIALFTNFVRYPLFYNQKSIVVVYDLSFAKFPQYAPDRNRRFLTRLVPPSLKRANQIVTISESVKSEIHQYYGTNKDKIQVLPCAVDPLRFNPKDQSEIEVVRKKYHLPRRYILFVSTLEPRKNVEGLIEAYRALPEAIKAQYALVLVGLSGWKSQGIEAAIGDAQTAGDKVVRIGYATSSDLAAIYSGASLFAYPSFYEGFGLPPLEAMACGVPVVTSNSSSLPEVVGDAALTIDPADQSALTAAMAQVLADPQLAADLRQKGLRRAKQFTWEVSAQRLLDIIKALA